MNSIKILSRSILLCLSLCFLLKAAIAQNKAGKLKIDSTVFGKWPNINHRPSLTPDGEFVFYVIRNKPVGCNTVVVKSVKNTWQKEIITRQNVFYNDQLNNTLAVFAKSNDTLAVVSLGRGIAYYPGYGNAKLLEDHIIASKGSSMMLLQKGMASITLENVKQYDFVLGGKAILLRLHSGTYGEKDEIRLLDLQSHKTRIVCKDRIDGNLVYNTEKDKIAFIVKDPAKGKSANAVVYGDLKTSKFTRAENKENKALFVSGIRNFNKKGDLIFIELTDTLDKKYVPNKNFLTVWHYKDEAIKPQEIANMRAHSYIGSISLDKDRIVRLQQDNETFISPDRLEKFNDACLSGITKGDCLGFESWNSSCDKSLYLLNLHSGQHKPLNINCISPNQYHLSPDNSYVFFYDYQSRRYLSYNTGTGQLINIGKAINGEASDILIAKGYHPPYERGLAGWMNDGKHVLVYDQYDIWKLDMTGKEPSVNLTNAYGRKNTIQFYLSDYRENEIKMYRPGQEIMLTAFNLRTKDNGFFKGHISGGKDPAKLTMGPYMYDWNRTPNDFGGGMAPIKALGKHIYLIMRSDASNFPNYYVTSNFKSFTAVSNIHPEKEYNWITTELHTYRSPDGEALQGILYKPSDFDPSKKYPIIFDYYERLSDGMNDYLAPEPLCNACKVNPPLIVGNGYLLFRPDLTPYKPDRHGESALIAIEAAVDHLSQYSYIDTTKMGIQGCSWGGFETNYFITHSNRFKAACSASGLSDLMGWASQFYQENYSHFSYGQFGIKTMLWEDPGVFINNSPLFRVNKINTPVLFMHTTIDGGAPFSQAAELFLSMRRLNKPAWLLEYGGTADHGLFEDGQQRDFSLRMLQFFDHYLKDKPAPKWMVHGIPAKEAATESGLEFTKSN